MTMRGIEIGHIFFFGKIFAAMGATVRARWSKYAGSYGSYGVGVSRLVGYH